jgi:hypothetical protein
MIKWLKSLFSRPAVIPLIIEAPPEWTDRDRAMSAVFFDRGVGEKMKQILYYEIMSDALRPGVRGEFEQGINQGKNMMLARILNLSEVEENTEEKA